MIDDGSAAAVFKLPAGTQPLRGLLLVELPKALLNNGGDTVRAAPDGSNDEHRLRAAQLIQAPPVDQPGWHSALTSGPAKPRAGQRILQTCCGASRCSMGDSALPSQAAPLAARPAHPRSAASAPQRAPARIPAGS